MCKWFVQLDWGLGWQGVMLKGGSVGGARWLYNQQPALSFTIREYLADKT